MPDPQQSPSDAPRAPRLADLPLFSAPAGGAQDQRHEVDLGFALLVAEACKGGDRPWASCALQHHAVRQAQRL